MDFASVKKVGSVLGIGKFLHIYVEAWRKNLHLM